jgi:hypothetical protein
MKFVGIKTGAAVDSSNEQLPFLAFQVTNLTSQPISLDGVRAPVGFLLGSPYQLLEKSDDKRTWELALPIAGVFSAGGDVLQLEPGQTKEGLIQLVPEVVDGTLKARYVRAVLTPNETSEAIAVATLRRPSA